MAGFGRTRPPGCPERVDWEFLRFAWSWNRKRRMRNLALVEAFAGRKIVLRKPPGRHSLGE